MATRKPLFVNANGFPEEMAATDDIQLGGLTMSGVIDMGSNQINNLADGTAATDAVTKQQLDAIDDAMTSDLAVEEAIAVGDPVEWGTVNDQVRKADAADDAKIDVFGVAVTAQATPGSNATITRRGVAQGVIALATVGDRYFLNDGGGLVQGAGGLAAGSNIVFVGTAKNADDLEVHPQFLGKKAA